MHVPDPAKRNTAIYIVLACTLLVAIGQYLIKLGANRLSDASLLATAIGIFTIPQLFAGYCLYAPIYGAVHLCPPSRRAFILYPLIALGYVWTTITAVLVLHESMNAYKIVGLLVIICGVAVLGWGGGGK